MESEDPDTFYCSFVGNHYIICECGDTFPCEDSLKAHLEKEHIKREKDILQKVVELEDNVAANVMVYSEPAPAPQLRPKLEPNTLYFINSTIKQEEQLLLFEASTEEETLTTLQEHLNEHHPNDIKTEYILDGEVLMEGDNIDYELQTQIANASQMRKEHDYGMDMDKAKEYYCEICGKGFSSEKSVSCHKTRMHQTDDNLPVKPKKKYSITKKVVCELCGKKYNSCQCEGKLPTKNKKRAYCEVCGKGYNSNAALRYHQRVHTGEKPYQCEICYRRFTMPLFLQIHVRTHTGERPYQCPLCPKAFSNKAALLRHDRVHTGVKPYTCGECGKSFTQSNSLKLHVRTVHLRLPAPYKSRARRLQARARALKQGYDLIEEDRAIYNVDVPLLRICEGGKSSVVSLRSSAININCG